MRGEAIAKKKKPLPSLAALTLKGKSDSPLLIITLILVVFGLITMYSASYASAWYMFQNSYKYIKGQVLYAVVGLVVMLIISRIDYHILHRFALPIFAVSYVLLCITLLMPTINDAKRWIIVSLGFGTFTFQPSELMKFAVILIVAHFASVNPSAMRTIKYGYTQFMVMLFMILIVMGLQPHLSGSIIIVLLMVILMFIGGSRAIWIFMTGAIGAPLAALVIFSTNRMGYVASRINVWLNLLDHRREGYQTFQSLIAIGSGGLFGVGLGNSRQKHLYLPESHNDFIFSIICEELGLIGAFCIIALFIGFVLRGLSIALRAKDRFGAMLVIGVTLQIGIQALLNIAVVSNSIPNTGISLPFFSQGGTSLMILLAEVGVILSVARWSNSKSEEAGSDKNGVR